MSAIGSTAAERRPDGQKPTRFRRRLALAFTLVAALAGAVLALTSYLLITEYRTEAFHDQAVGKAQLSLLSARGELSLERFEDLLAEYQRRGDFDTIAISGDVVFSSAPHLQRDDIPAELDVAIPTDDPRTATTRLLGEPYFVVGGSPAGSDTRLYFFFSEADVRASVSQFRVVLLVGWAAVSALAALIGNVVARQTLRPVREAAIASQSLAEGLLETRLEPSSDDEFGMWANSFNEMAAALQSKVVALQRAAARERQFTSDVAHELRTPLAGMVSAAELLADGLGEVPPRARRPAEILITDVRRLRSLVLELLELARLDAGNETLDVERLCVRDAVEAVAAPWQARDVPVAVRVDRDLHVLADRARFRRVMANLVDNAVAHGGRDVEITAHRNGDGDVEIEVADRGPGIDDGDVDRIFDRFYKADASRSSGGSGLGLAIARQQARAQDGDVYGANREGGGARFTFRLPAAPPVAP